MLFIQCEKKDKGVPKIGYGVAQFWKSSNNYWAILQSVYSIIYIVNGRWRKLQAGSKEQQTSHSQRFLILFLLFLF